MENTNGYIHDGKWHDDAANGQYLFAKKDGTEYFLKRFREPKFPKEGMSPQFYEAKKKECEAWKKERKNIISALQEVAGGGGNIVSPLEIFLDRPWYIQATRKVDTSSIGFDKICSMSQYNQLLLLKTLSMSMKRVHSVGIVHGDLKPDNILISETRGGKMVCKIIDFDDSYFSQNPPLPENTVGTEPYWSPELALYKISNDKTKANLITCKADIFALGLIFHQYCTGGKFPDLKGHTYAYQAVCAGEIIKADTMIEPLYLQEIINHMLLLNPSERLDSDTLFAHLSGEKTAKNVNIKAAPSGRGGVALVNKKQDIYVPKGTNIKFGAYPEQGYQFEYWEIGKETKTASEWIAVAEKDIVAIAHFKKKTSENTKWPIVEVLKENPKRVMVTFEDGRKRIMDKIIAETMGWKC